MDVVTNIPLAIIVAAIVGFLRSFTGWLENSLKDGVITEYEYKQLVGTVVKYVASILILMLGVDSTLPILGVDPATSTAAAVPVSTSVAYILDVVTSSQKRPAG